MGRAEIKTRNMKLEKERIDAIKEYMITRPKTHSRITAKEAASAIGCSYQSAYTFLSTSSFFNSMKFKGEYLLLKIPCMANSGPADLRQLEEPAPTPAPPVTITPKIEFQEINIKSESKKGDEEPVDLMELKTDTDIISSEALNIMEKEVGYMSAETKRKAEEREQIELKKIVKEAEEQNKSKSLDDIPETSPYTKSEKPKKAIKKTAIICPHCMKVLYFED